MFDVGFQEIVLIGVIALLVIGPERLPTVARSVGQWVGKVQRFVAGVRRDIQSEFKTDELRNLLTTQEDQIRELRAMVDETRTDLERTARSASADISEGMNQAAEQVQEAADAVRANTASAGSSKAFVADSSRDDISEDTSGEDRDLAAQSDKNSTGST